MKVANCRNLGRMLLDAIGLALIVGAMVVGALDLATGEISDAVIASRSK